MVSRYHPDRHQGNDLEELAKEKLIEVNEAYEVLSKSQLRAEYDAARIAAKMGPHVPPYGGGNYCAPRQPQRQSVGAMRKLVILVVVLAALPFLLRFIRSPRHAIIIGLAVLLAWLGPKILKRLKK